MLSQIEKECLLACNECAAASITRGDEHMKAMCSLCAEACQLCAGACRCMA